MAPRATVQQTVELLKIYQIRRENVLIHQQVQDLRDELHLLTENYNSLELAMQRNDSENNVIQKSLAETTTKVELLKSTTSALQGDQKSTETSLASLQDSCRHESKRSHNAENQLRDQTAQLEVELKRNTAILQARAAEMCNRFEAIEDTLKTKAETADINILAKRLSMIQNDMSSQLHRQRSVSRVNESVPEHLVVTTDASVRGGFQNRDGASIRGEPDNLCIFPTDATATGRFADAGGDDELPSLAVVPDDIDLDEVLDFTDQTQCLVRASPSVVSLHSLSDLETEPDTYLNANLSFKQADSEETRAYLKRGLEVCEGAPASTADMLLHRLVDGILNPGDYDAYTGRLNSVGWTWQNLSANLDLSLRKQYIVRLVVNFQARDDKEASETGSATVDGKRVPQTPQDHWATNPDHPKPCKSTTGVTLRRSQRIADQLKRRAHSQCHTASANVPDTPAMVNHSEAQQARPHQPTNTANHRNDPATSNKKRRTV